MTISLQSEPPLSASFVQGHAGRILRKSPYAQLRRVQCEVVDQTLFLRGKVTSFHVKQLAQESLRRLDGVDRIYNFVEVVREEELEEVKDGN